MDSADGADDPGTGASGTGILHVVATPIGNLEDITYRAVRVLREVGALVCEDTRHTRRILEHYGIPRPPICFSYHEHNEAQAGKRILGLLRDGARVALCSDGGSPGISDPGYRIVRDCHEAGFSVDVLPGPCAAPAALVASGLSTASFVFLGFPPRKAGARKRFLEAERDRPHTLVMYESPYRVGPLLADALEVLGNRLAAVCIELTKKFGRVQRGYLSELVEQYSEATIKGEVTVVISGDNPKFMQHSAPG